ncbi:flagellar assembly peptidoglycan hydrolase FlgJ [Denitratisoma sp. agr-D3]
MTIPAETNVFDQRGLADIKRLAKTNDPQALKAAARQFEALFLSMVLKSMRDASPQDGLMDSDQTRMYQSLLDQQLAQAMASKGNGTGLAAMIEKQLSQVRTFNPDSAEGGALLNPSIKGTPLFRETPAPALPSLTPPSAPLSSVNGEGGYGGGDGSATSRDFIAKVWPHAQEASRVTGIPAQFLVAHAALETGWGRAEPRLADGRSSFNLFGIKAGKSWNGAAAEASTTEYVDGVAQRQVERFRAYGSYAESFQDYAKLLAGNPRYANVLGAKDGTSFARGLQQAGYATDPAYAAKLERIINSRPWVS